MVCAHAAVLEQAVPHPPVQRIEVLDAHTRLRATEELAPLDRGFGNSILGRIASLDAEAHVTEDHVGDLVGRYEHRPVTEGRLGLAPAVEGDAAQLAVPGVVVEHHAVRRAVPDDDRLVRVLALDVQPNGLASRLAWQRQRAGDAVRAGGQIDCPGLALLVPQGVEGLLERHGVVGFAVARGVEVPLDVGPTLKRTDALSTLDRRVQNPDECGQRQANHIGTASAVDLHGTSSVVTRGVFGHLDSSRRLTRRLR